MRLTEGFNLLATAPDGIKRLRELILSLAVQGKLVPQDPSDEPASELLKQIRAEKDRLIAEGKIKKDKPLPAISDDENPFELPDGWEWVRLGDLGFTQTGGTPSKNEPASFGDDVPFVKPGDIFPNYVEYKNEGLSTAGAEQLGRLAPAGSILMVCIGTIGKCNFITRPCAFNQQINSISPLGGNSLFWLSVLRSSYFQAEAWLRSSSTTIAILNKGKWETIPVPMAPALAQSRIVAKVEELMALCDALETRGQLEAEQHARLTTTLFDALAASESAHQLQENWARLAASFDLVLDRPEAVDALEQTLLQLAVRGLLVPQDPADEPASELLKQIRAEKDRLIAEGKIKKDKPLPAISDEEKPFELPQGWEWVRLGQVSDFINGFAFPSNQFIDSGIGVVKIGDIQNGRISTASMSYVSYEFASGLDSAITVHPGDMLIAMSGATTGKLGFNKTNEVFLLNQRVGKITPFGVNRKFAFHYLTTKISENLQKSVGSAIPNLSTAQIKEIEFPLPPLAEQSRIVARVEALRALCGQLRERLAASRQAQAHLAEALVAQT
ncbi:restriction endonuclease subunit S [Vogesella amnigena]|uniref:Restriction endonuclease subunit S n=1 Tax=Vogesella amnigena TaxID=1507449 RepID=A0ABV7TYS1_9NEIS